MYKSSNFAGKTEIQLHWCFYRFILWNKYYVISCVHVEELNFCEKKIQCVLQNGENISIIVEVIYKKKLLIAYFTLQDCYKEGLSFFFWY